MGPRPRILLVATAFASVLAGCRLAATDAPDRVSAGDHEAFFLWAGVEPSAALENASTVYLHSGEIRRDNPAHMHSMRSVPKLGDQVEIWMTVRADRLDWDETVYERVLSDLTRWSRGNNLVGLQIDHDSPTGDLANYADFLTQLRARLPKQYQLSATGLLDWSAQGDPEALKALGDAVDDIVVQTYRGHHTVQSYDAYTDSLVDLPFPYRVGLVQNGEWRAPEGLETDPEFRGYVVFLLNE